MEEFECLKIENQLCFPLYVCSKEIIKKYTPFLDELDLTYTQYITMMIMWENGEINIKNLGEKLFLDSGTLTPLLKKLETKGYVRRMRSTKDERNLVVALTEKGLDLKNAAKAIPEKIANCINLSMDESLQLYDLLYKIIKENK